MEHTLKIEQNYLKNLLSGVKKAEVRYNDRDYQVGDTLKFWISDFEINKSKWVKFKITHIHSGLGLERGYVILSVEEDKC